MIAVIFGLVLVCYWPALHGAQLWDDPAHVTRPDLRSWHGLVRIWTELGATQQYYPVLHTAFWIEHRLWGDATLGYHLFNALLHATSCCLLALLVRRLLKPGGAMMVDPRGGGKGAAAPRPPSSGGEWPGMSSVEWPAMSGVEWPAMSGVEWLAAAIFAVHPVCVESVAWISEQKNTLSLVFYLLAALTYLEFAARRRWRTYGWATGWFLLALGSKTVTATLPAALLVVAWWKHGRLDGRRDLRPLLPWFAVAVASGLFTAWVERALIGAEGVAFTLSAGQRVRLAGRVVWFYLAKLIWPSGQAFFYPRWDVPAEAPRWTGYLLAVVAVTAGLWLLQRRTRGRSAGGTEAALAGWLLFVGSLFPALGFFNVYPFVFSFVADHFQYQASLWLIAAATVGLAAGFAGASARVRAAGGLAAALLVAALGLLARRQSARYVNDETLVRATLAQSPESWMAHHILGFRLAMAPGREAEAAAEFRAALRINPDYPDAHIGLALELARQPGHEAEAIRHYERALRLKPGAADAHNDLGLVLATLPGRLPEAIAQYEAALRLRPDFAEAQVNLANALAAQPGRLAEALPHFQAALRLDPTSPEMHDAYAAALARVAERLPEAVEQYEIALRLKPDYAGAHAGLADLLAELPGRLPEALGHYERALQLASGAAAVHYNYANALVKLGGRAADAAAQYEAALRLRPDFADAHANLANVLAGLPGKEPEAVAQYEAALRIDPRIAWVHLALALQLSSLPSREAEAMAQAREALRLQPDYPAALNCLAILEAQQGRFADARRHWEAALRLKPDYETARANLRRLDRLAAPAARGP